MWTLSWSTTYVSIWCGIYNSAGFVNWLFLLIVAYNNRIMKQMDIQINIIVNIIGLSGMLCVLGRKKSALLSLNKYLFQGNTLKISLYTFHQMLSFYPILTNSLNFNIIFQFFWSHIVIILKNARMRKPDLLYTY